jgi:tetratricopeptide (TPR) repeat protein
MGEEQKGIQQHSTGDYHATSVYGDASLHIHPPPVPSVLPERVWMIPYRRNPFFTGREWLLKELHERFTRDRAAVLTQGQAINGLGGIGKTQIAVEYAYRHRGEYRFVLWASAASQETLLAAYVTMADRLQLPERHAQEQDKIMAAVMHWLATHEGWLLIVDNADEMDMVWPMLPTGSMGHLLLTTRDQVVGGMQPFEVRPMDRAEGTLLLLRRAHVLKVGMELEQADREAAEQIVVEMDRLPLALDQAGAYIEEVGCSLQDYLAAYRQRRFPFLADRGRLKRDYPASVATTWALSFERVEQQSPAAADLLLICAFLVPDAIPEELIMKGARHLGPRLQPMETEPTLLQEMMRTLRAYSLIRHNSMEKTLSIHRLVQVVLQDALEEEERHTWRERAMLAVNAVFPDAELETWPQCERLLPQALAGAQNIEQYQMTNEEAARLLSQTAGYLYDRARYAEAEPLFRRALRIEELLLGTEHPVVAYLLNKLALLYKDQGKDTEAEPLYRRALRIWEQLLGTEHPDQLPVLNNLGALYSRQGKYAEAEPLYQRALYIGERHLGPKHSDVAYSLIGLARFYFEQGKYAEAEPLYRRALYVWEQHLGPEHPLVAHSLNGLGALYSSQGKDTEAEPLYQRALRIFEQHLGPEHPDVAQPLNNLANLYFEQGKYAEAEPLYQQTLRIFEQCLGPEHPEVATSLKELALCYGSQGKYAEAIPLFQRALRILEQHLGPEHPDVAFPIHGLAAYYSEQGKYAEAEPLYQRALHILEQHLGPEHSQVAALLNSLAFLYCEQGKYAEAEPLYRRTLCTRGLIWLKLCMALRVLVKGKATTRKRKPGLYEH